MNEEEMVLKAEGVGDEGAKNRRDRRTEVLMGEQERELCVRLLQEAMIHPPGLGF